MESDFVADQQSIVFVTIFKLLSYLADIATDTAAGITYCKVNYCTLPELWNYDEDSDEVKFPTRSTTAISLLRNVNETTKNHFFDKAPVYGFVTLGLLWLPGMLHFICQGIKHHSQTTPLSISLNYRNRAFLLPPSFG